jgi:hypothetical protein
LSWLIVDARSGVSEVRVTADGNAGATALEEEELEPEVLEVLPQAAATRAPTATRLSPVIFRNLWDPRPPIV